MPRRPSPNRPAADRVREIAAGRRPSKYRNVATVVDGIRFDSKAEATRWQMLKLLERAGGIRSLMRQVPFPLKVEGQLIATMRPDFSYLEGDRLIADDTKGGKPTADWLLKAKLLRALYPSVELRVNGIRMKP